MRRRDFIALVGGTAAAWPLAGRAQQKTLPVIGFMSSRSPEDSQSVLAGFRVLPSSQDHTLPHRETTVVRYSILAHPTSAKWVRSGHSAAVWAMSAISPKADIRQRDCHGRFVPEADSCTAAMNA